MPFPFRSLRYSSITSKLLALICPALTLISTAQIANLSTMSVALGGEPHPIFDGKSLEGWEGDTDHWRVEQGSIVGEIPHGKTLNKNTWLVFRGTDKQSAELKDFELRLQFHISGLPAANSGIQIRCQVDNVDHVSGYQADLDMGSTWLGRIYDEHGRALLVERGERVQLLPDGKKRSERFAPLHHYPVLFRENAWNDYRIVAIGEQIDVYVNGTLFSSLVDQQLSDRDLSGSLALQLHSGPETRIAFRDITLESLSDDDRSKLAPFELAQTKPEENGSDDLAEGLSPVGPDNKTLNLGFELGTLEGWTAKGNAFDKQPVNQDGISKRWPTQKSNKVGDYFIGGYEIVQDAGTGTLESTPFLVTHPYAGFLFGGGKADSTRVEVLLIEPDQPDSPPNPDSPTNPDSTNKTDPNTPKSKVVAKATGTDQEQMRRIAVDLREHVGKRIAVRLVDENAGGWGHMNFDDFRFYDNPPAPTVSIEQGPRSTFNAILNHLVPNPKTSSTANSTPNVAAAEALEKMFVPNGFSVDLIAAEPQIHQPVAFAFDPQGRLWVLEAHSYPQKRPDGEGLDRIVILEDSDADGSFETRKVFHEGLNLASGIEVGHGGVWVGAAPELLFIPDRNGDDRPDGEPEILLDGFGFGDTHETLNSFVWGPDGWLYGTQGVFNTSMIGKPGTREEDRTYLAAGVWRYDPVSHRFEVFAHGTSNPWGVDYDEHGQFFMTHCRSFWGKGGTTHVMHGGHYWNQVNSGYANFISNTGAPTAPHLQNFLLASARYDSGEGGAGKPGTGEVYGGHSHVGTAIYLGDNWPSEYRNRLLTHNLHGHQLNQQILRREQGGYNTIHAGQDVFLCSDPAFVGVDLAVGPDGAMYMTDWVDVRHCHNPGVEVWDRGNGRVYRMKYDATFKPARCNWSKASDAELVAALSNPNDWHVRTARNVLSTRYAGKAIPKELIEAIRKIGEADSDDTANTSINNAAVRSRLTSLWALISLRVASPDDIAGWLNDSHEMVRSWGVRSLSDPSALPNLAAKETSLLVRRELALAAGRLQGPEAWEAIETLSLQSENQVDRDLPVLLWQAIGKQWEGNQYRALSLSTSTPITSLRDNILWYAARTTDAGREAMAAEMHQGGISALRKNLELFELAMRGQRATRPVLAWNTISQKLYQSPDAGIRNLAEKVGAQLGDASLFARLRERLKNDPSIAQRSQAMEILQKDNSEQNIPLLIDAIDEPKLANRALSLLRQYDKPNIASEVLKRYSSLTPDTIGSAMDLLTSRVNWANALLDAMAKKQIPREALTAYYARQMALLGDEKLLGRIAQEWGQVRTGSEAMKEEILKSIQAYRGAPLWAFDAGAGKKHFDKLCAACHAPAENNTANGIRSEYAPNLQGTGAKGIEYAIENVIDPNAVIGRDYQARVVRTNDGQIITGLLLNEGDSSLSIRTATETIEVSKSDIEEFKLSENSFMPVGLLDTLDERQRIELFKYLLSL